MHMKSTLDAMALLDSRERRPEKDAGDYYANKRDEAEYIRNLMRDETWSAKAYRYLSRCLEAAEYVGD